MFIKNIISSKVVVVIFKHHILPLIRQVQTKFFIYNINLYCHKFNLKKNLMNISINAKNKITMIFVIILPTYNNYHNSLPINLYI